MIAHQGGWDEMLLVLGPIAVIIGLLALARKRVEASQRKKIDGTTEPPSAPHSQSDRPA